MPAQRLTPVASPHRARPFLARANPVSTLGAALILTIALLLTVDWVSAAVALGCEFALLPLAGLRAGTLFARGWPVVAAAVVGGYGTALLAPKTGDVLLAWGPLVFTAGSLESAAAIVLRGLAIGLPGLFLLASTDPTDLADALAQKLRLPHRFVLGALAALRLVGLLVAQWQTLALARRARGAGPDAGGFGRLRASAGQAAALLVQAMRRATKLAVAMEARGFGGRERTWARESTFAALDAGVLAVGMIITGGAVGTAVALGTWNPIWG